MFRAAVEARFDMPVDEETKARALVHRALGLQVRARLHALLLGCKFDSDQPRDERGRWVETGASDDENAGLPTLMAAARRRRGVEAECKLQYDLDIFQCKMVGLPGCFAQAMERWSACMAGRPIPPLNY